MDEKPWMKDRFQSALLINYNLQTITITPSRQTQMRQNDTNVTDRQECEENGYASNLKTNVH